MGSHGWVTLVFMGEPGRSSAEEWGLLPNPGTQHMWAARPSVGKAARAALCGLTQEGQGWDLGSSQHHAHFSPQLTMFPSPGTSSVATYRSIEFAFAIHGHEESTSDTKYAHHSSFHRRDFQQTCRGNTGISGTALKECAVSVLCSPKGSHPRCGSPCPGSAVGGRRTPASRSTCSSMPHAGISLLLAKYLFLLCPQASSCVEEVKISQCALGANETFVITQLISPSWILLFQLGIRVIGPRG